MAKYTQIKIIYITHRSQANVYTEQKQNNQNKTIKQHHSDYIQIKLVKLLDI